MTKNLVRGILNLVLAAAATWLSNYIVERVFGPDEIGGGLKPGSQHAHPQIRVMPPSTSEFERFSHDDARQD